MIKELTFAQFWDAYGLKRDRIAAERAWKRLGKKDQRAAMAGIAAYRASCESSGHMMMYAQGYLNHRRWEDECEPANGLSPAPSPVNETHSEFPDLEAGTRGANAEELAALEAFKQALREKKPAKPQWWKYFLTDVVDLLAIHHVTCYDGRIFFCKRKNAACGYDYLTVSEIDACDSYNDFYVLVGKFFNIEKIGFM